MARHRHVPDLAGWVVPRWLERQRDPRTPAFVPQLPGEAVRNRTLVSWTVVGALDSPHHALVDPAGAVAREGAGWSLDWWVMSEGRWYHPSREATVRQRLVGDAPVVETVVRVAGGDVVHRVHAARPAGGGSEAVVVEVENTTPVPVALALVLRPFTLEGVGRIGEVELVGGTLRVDGRPALVLPRPPASWSTADASGDVSSILEAAARTGEVGDGAGGFRPLTCPDALAQVAAVYPLPHTARIRAVVPLDVGVRTRGFRRVAATVAEPDPEALPDAAAVASGWAAQTERGAALELPDERLHAAVTRARRSLLLFRAGDEVLDGDPSAGSPRYRTATPLLVALARWGFPGEAGEVLASLEERQNLDGGWPDGEGAGEADALVLWAVGAHWSATGDPRLTEALVGPLARAAHRLQGLRVGRRAQRADGLLDPGRPDPALPGDAAVLATAKASRGLAEVVPALRAAGQPDVADDVATFAAEALAAVHEALGHRPPDPLATLVLAAIGALDPAGDEVGAALPGVGEHLVDGGVAHPAGAGLNPLLTLTLARVAALRGEEVALTHLRSALDLASPTGAWPAAAHPRGGGSMAPGHDPRVTAAFLEATRALVVVDPTPSPTAIADDPPSLVVLPVLLDGWRGANLEAHRLPTRHGSLSFAVRWHGDRPALLWELERWPGASGPVTLRAPGLHPTWCATADRGEELVVERAAGGAPAATGVGEGPAPEPEGGSFS